VKVLGERAALTSSVEFLGAAKGALTLNLTGDKPTPEQIDAIQRLANDKIREDVEIKEAIMSRSAAEEKYKNKVNHTFIYDKFPVPNSIKEFNIIEIPDWNVNCCSGQHLKRTGEVKALLITQNKYRVKKSEWEVKFSVGQGALDELSTGTKKELSSRPKKKKPADTQPSHSDPKSGSKVDSDQVPNKDNENIKEEKNKETQRLPISPSPSSTPTSSSSVSLTRSGGSSMYSRPPLVLAVDELVDLLAPQVQLSAYQLSEQMTPILNRLQNFAYNAGFQAGKSTLNPINKADLL